MGKTKKETKTDSLKKKNKSNIAKQNLKKTLNLKLSSKRNQFVVENANGENLPISCAMNNHISIFITSEMFDTTEKV